MRWYALAVIGSERTGGAYRNLHLMELLETNPDLIRIDHRPGVGLRFDCPLCRKIKIHVLFLNPLDGARPVANDDKIIANNRGQRWARSGMTFEEMSLSPSIDASKVNRADYPDGADGDIAYVKACRPCVVGGAQHWHGNILHGQLQTC